MLNETFQRYGQPTPPPELIRLRAGPLTMLYDPNSGMLRRIKLGEVEVLRGIYAAVRDRNWGTVPGTIREVIRNIEPQSFLIEFESEHGRQDMHFLWRGRITGSNNGELRYDFDGVARTTFLRNRIGFCVLHPMRECAGARAKQTRTDDREVESRFPTMIEPQIFGQGSFRDLRRLAHEIAGGLWAELEFEGDTFEMEDQRNWTDASFKTYCTPLERPFPVEVNAGTRICQAVTMRLLAAARTAPTRVGPISEMAPVTILEISDAPSARLPAIGLGVASHGEVLQEGEVRKLWQLRPAHLRLDLRLGTECWPVRLKQAVTEAEKLGARLELAVHLPRQGTMDIKGVALELARHAASLVRVLALREGEPATRPDTLQQVRQLLGGLSVPVGAGSDCNFCELNREYALGRLALPEADFVFWSINPQVHACDHLSVMETLEAQTATVLSARAFAGNRPLVVSPVTLKQRFNPVATSEAESTPPDELPPTVDARQRSDFAAAWVVGSLAALTSAGVESVTCFETTGWRGVLEKESGSPLPQQFPSAPGAVFPVFNALAGIAGRDHSALGWASLANDLAVLGLYEGKRLSRIVAANLTSGVRQLRLRLRTGWERQLPFEPYQTMQLDRFGEPEK